MMSDPKLLSMRRKPIGRRDLRRSEISGAHLQGTLLCETSAVEAKNSVISIPGPMCVAYGHGPKFIFSLGENLLLPSIA